VGKALQPDCVIQASSRTGTPIQPLRGNPGVPDSGAASAKAVAGVGRWAGPTSAHSLAPYGDLGS